MIAEGQALVLACLRHRSLGPFQLQAAIQALHCAGLRYEETDWAAIVRFYDRMLAVTPTPVVMMNRAIAVAETDGPDASLALLDSSGIPCRLSHPPSASANTCRGEAMPLRWWVPRS
jgi:RNA polymerase sigma-70 factor (ECF subfamily)